MTEAAAQTRVFILEDDPDLAGMLVKFLEKDGLRVTHRADGESAWEALAADPPDVVLADLQVPGISGHEFIAKIRGKAATAHTAVIVMSASIISEDQAEEMRGLLQADHVFCKPLVLRNVLLKVTELARRPR